MVQKEHILVVPTSWYTIKYSEAVTEHFPIPRKNVWFYSLGNEDRTGGLIKSEGKNMYLTLPNKAKITENNKLMGRVANESKAM